MNVEAVAADVAGDFAAADASLQTQCYEARRHIGLVKGSTGKGTSTGYLWTVEQVNGVDDYSEFWWTLNTHRQIGRLAPLRQKTSPGWIRPAAPLPHSHGRA